MSASGIGNDKAAMDVDTSDVERVNSLYHKQAEQSASNNLDEESEYEEEEIYIIASLPSDALSRANTAAAAESNDAADPDKEQEPPQYALIDVDSDNPLLELEGTIYRGIKDELLGSTMLFDIVKNDDEASTVDAKLLGTTSQVISFHQVKFSKR